VIPAVIYGVKSSPDERETVKDQHRIIRETIGDDSRIVHTFGEANQSGYRKERGPQLEAAMQAAIEAAAEHGEAELWVWHSSRLARGDGTRGRRSIAKLVHDLRYQGVTVRSATDSEMVTPMLAGIASTVSNKYSEDLSGWTKAGVKRRRERGQPVGALPGIGYEVEREIVDGRVVSRRIVSPRTGPLVVAMFERIAEGDTPGAVGRWLNDQGVRTIRGALFNQRTVRKVIGNDAFTGGNGYPRIVSDDLAQRARDQVVRLDPAEIQRRKGGRRPQEPYMLRGIVFCAGCGAAMYRSFAYRTGQRTYACRNRLEATGACNRPPIPAELLEVHVLDHLGSFVASVEGWLANILNQRTAEAVKWQATLDAKRTALADLDRRRDQRMAELAEIGFSAIGMEVIERIDRQVEQAQAEVKQAEAIHAEWSRTPDLDEPLDFYNDLVDAIQDRIKQAPGVAELNEALSAVLAGLWCELDPDRDYQRLLVQFALRVPKGNARLVDGTPVLDAFASDKRWLPPVIIEETGHKTTVSACPP
jgi:DNA invertase Pin-like site-specific DNA recombinase